MLKGQISLEMIIMLVVLIVLAGVIITLVLSYFRPGFITPPEETMKKREFEEKCKAYCESGSVEFCRFYRGGSDWNENKILYEIISVGSYGWLTCEDRVYCFLLYDCEKFGRGKELIERCKKVLCQHYIEGGVPEPDAKLQEDISFSQKCTESGLIDKISKSNTYNWVGEFRKGCTYKE
ncbi:MAG: hypothetical protein QXG91_01260 [Candidatus Aenigmatarchaeota archaeon]